MKDSTGMAIGIGIVALGFILWIICIALGIDMDKPILEFFIKE